MGRSQHNFVRHPDTARGIRGGRGESPEVRRRSRHARELRRAEDRSDVPPRKRPEDQKLATIAEFFAMSAETHSALDDAILSFAALEAFVARDVLRSFAILGGPRCGSVVFLSAPPGKSAAVVEIDIDNLELMAGYYPRRAATVDELAETMSKLRLDASSRVSRVAAAILTDAVWVPICSDEYESLKAHLGSIPRAHVAVACQTPSISGKWNSLESAAEILGASTAFPPRRPRTEPIRRDTVEWMRAVMIATCATKGISALASDWTMQTASRAPSAAPSDADLIAEARAVIEGKVPRNHANIAKPPGTLVEVKFKYSKPNEGAAPTVIEKTVHDPHRNPGFTTPAFDATDVTYGSGKIKTFISSRVASVASISVIRR